MEKALASNAKAVVRQRRKPVRVIGEPAGALRPKKEGEKTNQ